LLSSPIFGCSFFTIFQESIILTIKKLHRVFIKSFIVIFVSLSLEANSSWLGTPADETIPTTSSEPLQAKCDTFSDGLQTRGDDSTVNFSGGSAKLYNNPDSTLNTYNTPVNGGSGNDLTCVDNINGDSDQSCQTSNAGAATIEEITLLYPAVFTLATPVTDSTEDVSVHSGTPPLTLSEYDRVTSGWDSRSIIHANFNITNQLYINYLKLHTKEGKVTFDSSSNDPYNVTIGEFILRHTTVTNDLNTKNIKIGTLGASNPTNNLSLSASQTIKIDELKTKHTSIYNLTAQYVNINTLTDVSGSGEENTITIKADYIDIGTLNIGDATTLTIIPFTDGGKVIVKMNQFKTGSRNTINFAEGTYYIKTLVTSGSGDGYHWNMNGKVNLILEDDWNSNSEIAINAASTGGNDLENDSHSASNLFIYSKGNITMSNDTTIVGTIYSEKDITLGSSTYIKGALSAQDSITLGNGTEVYYDQTVTNSGYGECAGTTGGTISYISGPFDAWDVTDTDTSTPPVIADRQITTKIVNTPFRLSLASLNINHDAYEVKDIGTISVAIYPKDSTTAISTSIDFDVSNINHIEETSDIIVSSANRDAVVGFKLCATYKKESEDSNVNVYTLHNNSECSGALQACDTLTSDTPTWHICHSTDNFAIRPHAFRVFRSNSYARAGEDFNISIRAVDLANFTLNSGDSNTVIGTPNYNVAFSDIALTSNFYGPTHNELITMYKNVMQNQNATNSDAIMEARVATCSSTGFFTKINSSDNFTDGNLTAELKFSETGILTIEASEIIGQEFAIVDADDTDVSQRLILGSTIMKATSDISIDSLLLVNPYSIDTTAEYNTSTSKAWIYMDDISDAATSYTKPIMSAYLHYTVTARNKDGAITQNFTSTCFPDVTEGGLHDSPRVNGLKLNTTYDFKLTATINSTATVNLSIYNGDTDNNALSIVSADQDAALSVGDNSVRKATMYPKQFTNGIAESYVHFNVDRNVSTALNPVTIKVVDINSWIGWSSSASPAAFNGTTLNKSYNYVYGRTNAQRQRFTGESGDALIYFETYCYGTTCDKTLLPNGVDSNATDDPRWFINTTHAVATDGNAGTTSTITQKGSASLVTTSAISSENPSKATLNYSGDNFPYKTTMKNKASDWLIHNKYNSAADTNEFNVEFINANSDWAGQRETNNTTTRNASDTTNRRTMW